MRDYTYLVFNQNGITGMRKNTPNLRAGEFAVRVYLEVDDKYFARVIPVASLVLDERHIMEPDIDVQVEEVPEPEA